jgi:hypothetical protein
VYCRDALPAMWAALAEGRLSLVDMLRGLRVREVDRSEWSTVDAGGEFALNINTEAELLARCGSSTTAP